MLEYVQGTIAARGADWVVLDLRGLGIRISAPIPTVAALPALGEETRLWTHLYVREDVRALYGFASEAERSLFVQLLGVSGVGPRMALALLSMLRPERLAAAIEAGDEAALARTPGVGKKTASRMVLDLKGKVRVPAGAEGLITVAGADDDAMQALLAMGLTRVEAATVLGALPVDPARTLQETLMLALQAHARRGQS